MLRPLMCLLLLMLSSAVFAQAQQKPQRFGDLTVHYNMFHSSYLEPDVAANTGLQRGPTHGVMTILVERDTATGKKPVDALVSGTVDNLLQQSRPLDFIRIEEGDALYFVANYTSAQRGVLRFKVNIQAEEGAPVHTLQLHQEFFPDE